MGLLGFFEFLMFIEIMYLYVKHITITSTEAEIAYLMSMFITTTKIGTKKTPPPMPI